MPNVRGKNQTLISCPMDAGLLEELDGARGHTTRSQFLRTAIVEKLRSMGLKINEDLVFPPDRVSMTAKVSGKRNTVKQSLLSTSHVPASAKHPKAKRGKRKPPEK